MRYLDYLQPYLQPGSALGDVVQLRDGRLIFADTLDLHALIAQHGAPLEIAFCPLITRRVAQMHAWFAAARARTGYTGAFVYAYATKANFAAEVTRTVLAAGAHYETSSAFDVRIAHRLWQRGLLPDDRFILCNGSKEPAYIQAILDMRRAGFANIVPILDDADEFAQLAECAAPLLLGVRERKDPGDLAEGATYGADRFGMLPDELDALAEQVAATHHRIVLYHAMVGSQLEDQAFFVHELLESLDGYARLLPRAPGMRYFDFGGGMPTAYQLDFAFDYAVFAELLLRSVADWCARHGVPPPDLVGEFGRYSVAEHGIHIFQLGKLKPGHPGRPPWYLLNTSLMVSLPDILIVKGQQFIALPLNYFDAEAGPVTLGGRRTCDSDDFYPRTGDPPLVLPFVTTDNRRLTTDQSGAVLCPQSFTLSPQSFDGDPLLVAFFGTGAYQAMLSGEGGAHHCLAPEATKLIIEEQRGTLTTVVVPEQRWENVLADLGYT